MERKLVEGRHLAGHYKTNTFKNQNGHSVRELSSLHTAFMVLVQNK